MAGSSNHTVLYSVAGAALLTTIAGGLGAALVAAGWPKPFDSSLSAVQLTLSGVWVGGLTGCLVGGFLGMHGSLLGASTANRAEAAPLWGLVAGVLGGASLGPVFAGVLGLSVNYFLDSHAYFVPAALFGALAGPVLGVLGWQASYWIADFLRALRERRLES